MLVSFTVLVTESLFSNAFFTLATFSASSPLGRPMCLPRPAASWQGEDREPEFARRRRGVDAQVQGHEAHLPGVQVRHHLHDVGAVAAQPVQAGHGHCVPGTQGSQ